MKRIGNFVKSFLPILLYLIIEVAVTVVLMILFGVVHFAQNPGESGIASYLISLSSDTDFTQITSVIFALLIILIFGRWYRRVFVRPLRKKERKYWSGVSMQIVISLIFLAFGLQYVAQIVTELVTTLNPAWMTAYEEILENAGYTSVTPLLLVYSIVLAPACEELTFRGLTYRFARRALPFWGANILQALLFGLLHMNVVQGVYAFVIGLFFGWICRTGHSIKYTIALHMLFNALGTLFSATFELTTSISKAGFYAFGLLLTFFGMFLFHREFAKRNRERN